MSRYEHSYRNRKRQLTKNIERLVDTTRVLSAQCDKLLNVVGSLQFNESLSRGAQIDKLTSSCVQRSATTDKLVIRTDEERAARKHRAEELELGWYV